MPGTQKAVRGPMTKGGVSPGGCEVPSLAAVASMLRCLELAVEAPCMRKFSSLRSCQMLSKAQHSCFVRASRNSDFAVT